MLKFIRFAFPVFFLAAAFAADKDSQIHVIPKTIIELDQLDAQAFPGMGLQMRFDGYQHSREKAEIWDLCIAKGKIFLSLPNQNLVLSLSVATTSSKPKLIGPQPIGGNGVPLKKPGFLGCFNERLSVTSLENGEIFHLDLNGEITNFDDLKTKGLYLPSPDYSQGKQTNPRRFLRFDPHQSNILLRLDTKGRTIMSYGLGPDSRSRRQDPMDWYFRAWPSVQEDWTILVPFFARGMLYHIGQDGLVFERLILKPNPANHYPNFPFNPDLDVLPSSSDLLLDAQYESETYWLLIQFKGRHTLLKKYKNKNTLYHLTKSWTGLRVKANLLVLFDRKLGTFEVHTAP